MTLLGVLFFAFVVLASDSIQAKNVLILFAFESGLPANDLIYKNLRATLDSQINEPVNYYIVPERKVHYSLSQRGRVRVGVNIISGLSFPPPTSPNGRGVFVQALYYRNSRATGILIDLKLENNLEKAMSLSPDATDIYVVSGASPLDQFFEWLARDAYRRYEDKFKISYLNGLPMDELLQDGCLPKRKRTGRSARPSR